KGRDHGLPLLSYSRNSDRRECLAREYGSTNWHLGQASLAVALKRLVVEGLIDFKQLFVEQLAALVVALAAVFRDEHPVGFVLLTLGFERPLALQPAVFLKQRNRRDGIAGGEIHYLHALGVAPDTRDRADRRAEGHAAVGDEGDMVARLACARGDDAPRLLCAG